MSHSVVAFVTTMIIIAMSIGFVKRFLQVYTNVTEFQIFRHFKTKEPNNSFDILLKHPEYSEHCQILAKLSFAHIFGRKQENPEEIPQKKVEKGA